MRGAVGGRRVIGEEDEDEGAVVSLLNPPWNDVGLQEEEGAVDVEEVDRDRPWENKDIDDDGASETLEIKLVEGPVDAVVWVWKGEGGDRKNC